MSEHRAPILPALAVGAALFLAGALWLRHTQSQAVGQALSQWAGDAPGHIPENAVAQVASAVASLNLVTVVIDTAVRVERGDDSWRGHATAAIEVPVRLSYGVDLSAMDVSSIAFSPGQGTYIVRVPPARRISTEVFTEQTPPKVDTGWLRLRSRAGEYYLSQARRDAAEAARSLRLRPEDAARVREVTQEQVAKVVRAVAGRAVPVVVVMPPETPQTQPQPPTPPGPQRPEPRRAGGGRPG